MAENSRIEWTHHTSSGGLRISPEIDIVSKFVAPNTKSDAVPGIEPEISVCRKVADVVGVKVPAFVVATMGTRETVPTHHVVAPPFEVGGEAQPSTLNALPVDVAGGVFAAQCSLSRGGTDLGSNFIRVRLPQTVTWSRFCRRTHLCAALARHFLSLHRRDKSRTTFLPRLLNNLATGQFSHG